MSDPVLGTHAAETRSSVPENHSKCAMRPSASARTLRVDRNLTSDQQVVRERGHRTSVRAALSSLFNIQATRNFDSFVGFGLPERPADSYLVHHRGTLNG